MLLVPVSLAIVGFVWTQWLPPHASWAFGELSLRSLVGIITVPLLALIPLYVPGGAIMTVAWVLEVYADASVIKLRQALNRGSAEQSAAEADLAREDDTGLVPLLRYSRLQLESYYEIGLTQTQRSFRYGVVAMWIGFAVILIGIVIQLVDLDRYGVRPLESDVDTLILISGAIIEVISALFLWVYRSSIRQLTYFYNRQMYNHSALMSAKIAGSMSDGDATRSLIVDRLLDKTWATDPGSLPSGTSLFPRRPPPPSAS